MEENLVWLNDLERAKKESMHRRKAILLQFHRDKCSGCKKLYALTYPDSEVAEEIQENFIPLRLDILANRTIRSRLSAIWTPSFYILDYREKLYYSFDGYLNVEDFLVFLLIARSKYLLPHGKYNEVIELIKENSARFETNPRAAELLFLQGQAEYLRNWDNKTFSATMDKIVRKYPLSLQARMYPWMD